MTDHPASAGLQLITTADGSNTLFNEQVGEHYHSTHGAFQESRHVFLESGLKFFLEKSGQKEVSILEIGFGTGLNFLLSAGYCLQEQLSLNYTGVEAYPLPEKLIFQTDYEKYLPAEVWDKFIKIYTPALNKTQNLNNLCKLIIAACRLLEFRTEQQYDVLYFDAFAAVHQPEMWTAEAIEHCTRYLKKDGVFVTYAITGNLKRIMKSLNFSIEKVPGAPGKREMLRAVKKL